MFLMFITANHVVIFPCRFKLIYSTSKKTSAVERHRLELYRAKERYFMKLHMLLDDPAAPKLWTTPIDKARSLFLPSSHHVQEVYRIRSLI
jgi:hypothetical protein